VSEPVYESKDDILRSIKVVRAICKVYGFTYESMKKFSDADYILRKDGKLFAFVEVKCRNSRMRDHPDYRVSVDKIDRVRLLARRAGAKAFMIVRWNDCMGTFDLNKIRGDKAIVIGRHDRPESKKAKEPQTQIDFSEIKVHDIVIPWSVKPKKTCDCKHRDMWICGADKMINHKSKEVTCSCKCHTKRVDHATQ